MRLCGWISARLSQGKYRDEDLMYFVAAILTILFCLFYAAGQQEIGTLGVEMCRYGSTFCRSPTYVLAGAILAALWGALVSVR
jgi:hypothetical protein